MALFEAPGWDTGTTPIVNGPSGPPLSTKRSKRKRAESNDEASDATPSTTQFNLQKLMRKMRLESYSKKNPSANGTSSSHLGTFKDDPKNRRSTTKMDPPDSPVSKTTKPLPPQSSSPLDQTATLPPSKKPRIEREESDILPPSSAGDGEEDAGSVLSHIKTKKRSKKQRKLAAVSMISVKRPADAAAVLVDTSDTGMETETDGNRNIVLNTGRPTHGWKAIEDDSSSGEFAGLTKLQREMKQKLSGGRFRYAQF